nr:cell wall hydrolase [Devosia sp.]
MAAGVLASIAYVGLANSAFGPSSDGIGDMGLPVAKASLSYSGVDPIITGSINHLFETASFTGPNRAAKTDRVRPAADPVAISRSFEEVRLRLAALRAPPPDPTDLGQSRFAAAEDMGAGEEDEGPRMSVAALHPNAAAALDAIAGIAPRSEAPPVAGLPDTIMPDTPSTQLAYARANTPATGGMATGDAMTVSDRELWCLATAIYFEARGESYRGQVAVAQVVLNRVKDHRYPDTICGVVFQNQHRRNACQFSFACDGIPEVVSERQPWVQAEDISKKVTSGELYLTEVGKATHYHATYVRPAWAPRMEKLTQIGLHVFYQFKRGWLFG